MTIFSEHSTVSTPDKNTNNTFFNSMLLKAPQCDKKLEVSKQQITGTNKNI